MSTITKPKFLSSAPSGSDLFEGKSHQKTANTLFELINDNAFPTNVIGLEGHWGSGKSNVIRILNKKFKEVNSDYSFFTYDAWAHQEDLTRKTFLEELISKLQSDDKFKENVDWNKELEKLMARTSKSTVEKFPKIKFYWILIMGSIVLFTFLNILYSDFWSDIDILPTFSSPFLKIFLFKYLFPVIVFCWGVYELIQEFNELGEKDETRNFDYKERFKRLFYIFSGSDLTSEEHEQIIENEPSVKQFKDYFIKIKNDINNDGLIIVFDNMDRLSNSEKVLSLWSSIYTFFAEAKIERVWVIIPFDRKHLAQHFENGEEKDQQTIDNFLGKTFSTVFRIAPPVLSDWKKFFEMKFREAFSNDFETSKIEFISSLFEQVIDLNKRTPRDIITFLNNLVSLYLQHSQNINIEYLALFALRKDRILRHPLVEISSKGFFDSEEYLFNDVKELEESLGAIVYNVDKEKANEVLLKNSIEEIIRKGDLELLSDVKNHSEFPFYFNNIIQNTNLEKIEPAGFVKVLEDINDVILESNLKGYWINFAFSITRTRTEVIEFKEWHKITLMNLPQKWANEVAQQLIEQVHWEFGKKISALKYYSTLEEIMRFFTEEKVDFFIKPPKTKYEPKDFLEFVDDLKDDFGKEIYTLSGFNIYCLEENLNQFFLDKSSDFIESVHSYRKSLKYLMVNENFNLDKLNDRIRDEVSTVPYNKKEDINMLVAIMNDLFLKQIWPKFAENQSITYLNQPYTDELAYPYMLASQISRLTTAAVNHQIAPILNKDDLAKSVAPVIQNYLSLSQIFKLFVEKNKRTSLIKEVLYLLTKDSYGYNRKLDIPWTFQNLVKIKSLLFSDNFEDFLEFFDAWEKFFHQIEKEKTSFFGEDVITLSFENSWQEYNSIEKIKTIVQKDLKSKKSDEWLKIFQEKDIHYFALKGYLENDLLDPRISRGREFMNAYGDYLSLIAKREEDVPIDYSIWNKLVENDYLHKGRLSKIFNDVLDYLLEHSEIEHDELNFFLIGLLKYSSNIYSPNKIDDSIRKLILELEKDDITASKIIPAFKESIIRLLLNSGHQYDQHVYDMLIEKKENKIIEEDIIDEILKESRLKLTDLDENDESDKK